MWMYILYAVTMLGGGALIGWASIGNGSSVILEKNPVSVGIGFSVLCLIGLAIGISLILGLLGGE